ncbi:hydroxymethylglutaryl-CoA lyase [Sphingobium sp. SA916]|uniref:hydroxymethylglutaryl-CoA lyase n=1 Tax=Sphingobium sp. SA916 TaxID=1851207 RepID=UPI000C9F6336|nr:hydroxymethylglutaryl-CoA lyase [Sphingobium sp. SA916]PNP96736.1 hydroxymethylglutaryl-CoA lyase [Sphingobium sp. SA916]
MTASPRKIRVTEVGMRDGFQMESRILPTDTKVAIGEALIASGIRNIEVTSFVSPAAVPQLADAANVVGRLSGKGAELSALVPNAGGARRAVAAGIDRVTIFASASETHNIKNVRRTVAESLAGFDEIGAIVGDAGTALGGAVATSFGCPFEGEVPVDAVLRVIEGYLDVGADLISLGDTTGMATPPVIERVVLAIRDRFPDLTLALHFHNTRGLGLVNVVKGLELGIDRFDASVGGLGGCPFAAGATGNICTEDLVYMLDELGLESGIDLPALISVAKRVESEFGWVLPGQVMKAGPRLHLAES